MQSAVVPAEAAAPTPGAKAGQPVPAAADKASSAAGVAAAVAAAALIEALAAASPQAAAQVTIPASKHVALLVGNNIELWLLLCCSGTAGQHRDMIWQGLLPTCSVALAQQDSIEI